MKSRGNGGGADLGGLLGSLMQSSNSGGWKKQTPVLSSNEVQACFALATNICSLHSQTLDYRPHSSAGVRLQHAPAALINSPRFVSKSVADAYASERLTLFASERLIFGARRKRREDFVATVACSGHSPTSAPPCGSVGKKQR